ncbi:hypothetical protein J6590_100165, partial [Homalodisca vitripennis]
SADSLSYCRLAEACTKLYHFAHFSKGIWSLVLAVEVYHRLMTPRSLSSLLRAITAETCALGAK